MNENILKVRKPTIQIFERGAFMPEERASVNVQKQELIGKVEEWQGVSVHGKGIEEIFRKAMGV